MRWLGQTPPDAVSGPFRLITEGGLDLGVPPAAGLVFVDKNRLWRDAMSGLSLTERRGCIAVALGLEDLVAAAQWSIGGGVLLPPSISRVSAACRASQEARSLPLWSADHQVVDEMSRGGDCLGIRLEPNGLWEALVGLRGRLEVLTALAIALERPAVIGPGPRLVVTGVGEAAIESVWTTLEGRPQWAVSGSRLAFERPDLEPITRIDKPVLESGRWPVAQWPSGRIVGQWSLDPKNQTRPWRLEKVDGQDLQAELVSNRSQLLEAATDIIRIDGIPPSDLDREGSPGAVVVEALAREADRSGQTLWIPGVSRTAGAVIRQWGLSVWVDGPVLAH